MTGSRTAGLSKRLVILAFGALSLGILAPGCLAQNPTQIEREVEFVRDLAKDMRFISLAQNQVERLQTQAKNPHDQDLVSQLGIEVAFYGAKTSSDRAQQRQRYKETIEKSKELLDRSSDAELVSKARATLADAAQEFGQFLNDEIAIAQVESPDRVKELEEEAGAVFKAGIESCDKVMNDLEAAARKDKDGPKYIERGIVWLRKGILMREQGRAVKADRGFLIERAKATLEEMVFEYGEETALGLRGLFELAQCDELAGKTKDAIDAYQGTITQISTSLDEAPQLGLNADTQAFLFNMQQEVFSHLADMLFEQGDTAACEKLLALFDANLQKFGEKGLEPLDVADPRYGHLTFLVKCRLLAETGDANKVKEALELAKKINDYKGHENDLIGVRAKAVIRDILAAQQSLVSGKLLFEVAKGDYQNSDFEKAIKGLRKALATMTKGELDEFGTEAYTMLGLSFARSDRFLEAVLAFQYGLQKVGKDKDDKTQKLAEWLDKATSQLNAVTKKDAAFVALTSQTEQLVKQYGSETQGDPRHWQKGDEALTAAQRATDPKVRKEKADEAAAEYQAVSKEYLRYEEARVRVAVAKALAGDYPGAQQIIDDYRKWLETKDAILDPKDSGRQQVRSYANAEADFREAVLLYDTVTGQAPGTSKQLDQYPAAIDKLNAFLSNHQKDAGDQLLAFALDRLGRLYTANGQLDKAEEAYGRLKAKDPQGRMAPALATVIFDEYLTNIGNQEKELAKAITDENKSAITSVREQLDSKRKRLANLGGEYIKGSAQPQIGIMVSTMNQYEELHDWLKVSDVAKQIIAVHGESTDPTTKDMVDMVVRPKIGEALLEQGQFQDAYNKLVEAEKANPNQWELKRLIARALGGWYYFDERGAPKVQPALGRPAEAYEKYWNEYKRWGLRADAVKQYSYAWYRFYWECYWFALQAARKDSKYMGFARSLYGNARSINNFDTLRTLPDPKAADLYQYFKFNPVK